jgi:hypothetical protein
MIQTPGSVAYRAYQAAFQTYNPAGVKMGWEHIGELEQDCWEYAAQAVMNAVAPPPTGPVSAQYIWSGGTPPPVVGQFESNSRNWNGAALLVFWPLDNNGQDLTSMFSTLHTGQPVHAQQTSNASNWRTWTVSAAVTPNADGTWNVPVTSTDNGGNSPSNGQSADLTFG